MLAPPDSASLVIVLDLPFPPSTNRIWRTRARPTGTSVYLAPEYRKWKDRADMTVLSLRQYPRRKIGGAFTADIVLDVGQRKARGDLDNRIKATLDWIVTREIVRDDRDLDALTVSWGEAPHGARVTLRAAA